MSFNRGAEKYCQPRPPLFLFLFSTAGMEKTDERQIKGVDPIQELNHVDIISFVKSECFVFVFVFITK
jgi:hypothetical protein